MPSPNCEATSPTAKRFDRVSPPPPTLPDIEMVGSIRADRNVYISRTVGSRRGPPMNGDDSGCYFYNDCVGIELSME